MHRLVPSLDALRTPEPGTLTLAAIAFGALALGIVAGWWLRREASAAPPDPTEREVYRPVVREGR